MFLGCGSQSPVVAMLVVRRLIAERKRLWGTVGEETVAVMVVSDELLGESVVQTPVIDDLTFELRISTGRSGIGIHCIGKALAISSVNDDATRSWPAQWRIRQEHSSHKRVVC